jgi:hypothetical protein
VPTLAERASGEQHPDATVLTVTANGLEVI